jgi:hypothetical protein
MGSAASAPAARSWMIATDGPNRVGLAQLGASCRPPAGPLPGDERRCPGISLPIHLPSGKGVRKFKFPNFLLRPSGLQAAKGISPDLA